MLPFRGTDRDSSSLANPPGGGELPAAIGELFIGLAHSATSALESRRPPAGPQLFMVSWFLAIAAQSALCTGFQNQRLSRRRRAGCSSFLSFVPFQPKAVPLSGTMPSGNGTDAYVYTRSHSNGSDRRARFQDQDSATGHWAEHTRSTEVHRHPPLATNSRPRTGVGAGGGQAVADRRHASAPGAPARYYCFPRIASTTQHPKTCGRSARQ